MLFEKKNSFELLESEPILSKELLGYTCDCCGDKFITTVISTTVGKKPLFTYTHPDGSRFCSDNCLKVYTDNTKKQQIDEKIKTIFSQRESFLKNCNVPSQLQSATLENHRNSSTADMIRNFIQSNGFVLLLLGTNSGIGKSHLATASMLENIKTNKEFSTLFVSSRELQYKMKNGKHLDLEQQLIKLDYLVLDDLGSESITDSVISMVFGVINGRLSNGKKTVVTTNLTIEEVSKTYGQRMLSRLSSGMVIELKGYDYRTKGDV